MTLEIDNIKWANDPSSLKLDATSNQRNRGWDTNDGTAEGRPDRPTLQHVNGWKYAVYKWIQYINSIRNPLGTIIRSDLTEAQFYEERDPNKWVLMDGRSMAGSALSTLTGELNVPDARGNVLIMGGENSDTNIETIVYPGQTIEDNASLDCVNLTAPVGGEAYELGRNIVDMEGIDFQGDTSFETTRAYMYDGYRTIKSFDVYNPQNYTFNFMIAYDSVTAGFNDIHTFDYNLQHSHVLTGKITDGSVTAPLKTETTVTNIKPIYNNRSVSQLNKFNPKARCCNFFIRIN